jgi:hypothetical protein
MTTPELELESRLVAYVAANFTGAGEPLENYSPLAGHSADERPITYLSLACSGAGGELSHAGIYEVVVRALVMSQADDESMADHGAAVAAIRVIFSQDQLTTVINAVSDGDFALSGLAYEGSQEARDEAANRHGTEESWRAWAAILP